MIDYEEPGNFDFLEDEEVQDDCFNPETGELLLGDIVISAPESSGAVRRVRSFQKTGVCISDCPQYASSDGVRPHGAG